MREAARAKRVKEEGKVPVIGAPNGMQIDAAQALLTETFPNLPKDTELGKRLVSAAAFDLASEAQALMKKNRGLSASEAMQQAFEQMKTGGMFEDIAEVPPTSIVGLDLPWTGKAGKTTYRRGGKKDDGLTLPAGVTPTPLPPKGTALKAGTYYQTPKGTVLWDGKVAKLVPGKATKAVPDVASDDDLDDLDE
jgi:hypothetical protein